MSIYTASGIKSNVARNTCREVVLKVDGELYKDYFIAAGQTSKNVMLAILKYMDDDMNTIQVNGDTLDAIIEHTGYNKQVVRNQLVKLQPLIEKTSLRGEYIVNPMFAVKGDEKKVWNIYKKMEQYKVDKKQYLEDNDRMYVDGEKICK